MAHFCINPFTGTISDNVPSLSDTILWMHNMHPQNSKTSTSQQKSNVTMCTVDVLSYVPPEPSHARVIIQPSALKGTVVIPSSYIVQRNHPW